MKQKICLIYRQQIINLSSLHFSEVNLSRGHGYPMEGDKDAILEKYFSASFISGIIEKIKYHVLGSHTIRPQTCLVDNKFQLLIN